MSCCLKSASKANSGIDLQIKSLQSQTDNLVRRINYKVEDAHGLGKIGRIVVNFVHAAAQKIWNTVRCDCNANANNVVKKLNVLKTRVEVEETSPENLKSIIALCKLLAKKFITQAATLKSVHQVEVSVEAILCKVRTQAVHNAQHKTEEQVQQNKPQDQCNLQPSIASPPKSAPAKLSTPNVPPVSASKVSSDEKKASSSQNNAAEGAEASAIPASNEDAPQEPALTAIPFSLSVPSASNDEQISSGSFPALTPLPSESEVIVEDKRATLNVASLDVVQERETLQGCMIKVINDAYAVMHPDKVFSRASRWFDGKSKEANEGNKFFREELKRDYSNLYSDNLVSNAEQTLIYLEQLVEIQSKLADKSEGKIAALNQLISDFDKSTKRMIDVDIAVRTELKDKLNALYAYVEKKTEPHFAKTVKTRLDRALTADYQDLSKFTSEEVRSGIENGVILIQKRQSEKTIKAAVEREITKRIDAIETLIQDL